MAGAVSLPKNPTQIALLISLVLLVLGVFNRFTHINAPSPGGGEVTGQRPARDNNLETNSEAIEMLTGRIDRMQKELPKLVANQLRDQLSSNIQHAVAAVLAHSSNTGAEVISNSVKNHHALDAGTELDSGNGNCASAILTEGLPARTEEEVMSKSKQDKQYLGGIKNKAAVGSLVDSADYWEKRYAAGGNSGAGSYNMIGVFKAEIVNNFVRENGVKHVIEFGFGDGQQLTRAEYPFYTGLDVSKTILEKTSKRFAGDTAKEFRLYDGHTVPGLTADLTLSFDVIYHLVEDQVYYDYMDALFSMSTKYVIVYSSNIDGWHGAAHVLHRNNTKYISKTFPAWKFLGSLRNKYPEKTAQDFFFYAKCE